MFYLICKDIVKGTGSFSYNQKDDEQYNFEFFSDEKDQSVWKEFKESYVGKKRYKAKSLEYFPHVMKDIDQVLPKELFLCLDRDAVKGLKICCKFIIPFHIVIIC